MLSAIARSNAPARGSYRLVFSKETGSGNSRSFQDGPFELQPNAARILARTAFEAAAAGHVRASLRLETDRGIVKCAFPN